MYNADARKTSGAAGKDGGRGGTAKKGARSTASTRLGQPLSEILTLPAEANNLRDVVKSIEQLHGAEPPIAPVPVVWDSSLRSLAKFESDPATQWLKIRVSPHGLPAEIPASFTHEIGHMMDALAAHFRGFASETVPEFERWRQLVRESTPINHLESLRSAAQINGPDGAPFQIAQPTVEYLLRKHEIFARCYAQYVAARTGNPALRRWLDLERDTPLHQIYPGQWTEEEFAPIADEMDSIFRGKKWRT